MELAEYGMIGVSKPWIPQAPSRLLAQVSITVLAVCIVAWRYDVGRVELGGRAGVFWMLQLESYVLRRAEGVVRCLAHHLLDFWRLAILALGDLQYHHVG